jgi:RNA polymerase sigma-70 factor (ECF subfamily)
LASTLRGVTADLDALLRRVAQQDVEAFATFYDHTRARVFGMVVRVLRDPGYSEETTQDVYLQVWRNAAGYNASCMAHDTGAPQGRRPGALRAIR